MIKNFVNLYRISGLIKFRIFSINIYSFFFYYSFFTPKCLLFYTNFFHQSFCFFSTIFLLYIIPNLLHEIFCFYTNFLYTKFSNEKFVVKKFGVKKWCNLMFIPKMAQNYGKLFVNMTLNKTSKSKNMTLKNLTWFLRVIFLDFFIKDTIFFQFFNKNIYPFEAKKMSD